MTDPAEIEERVGEFQQRAFYYYENWERLYEQWKQPVELSLWQKLVPLEKGRYEYKFFVDGNWRVDPDNPNKVNREFGENSYIEID